MTQASSDDRLWALLAHVSYLFLAIVGPLIIWLVKKEDSKFVESQAKEALNFQLSVFLVGLVCGVTVCLLPVTFILVVGGVVYSIIAAFKAYEGEDYQYPYTIRLIK